MLLVIATLGVIILLLFIFLVYSGLLRKIVVKVAEPPLGAGTFIYKFYTGPYREAAKAFNELMTMKLTKRHTPIGIYYDDPEKVIGKYRPGDFWSWEFPKTLPALLLVLLNKPYVCKKF